MGKIWFLYINDQQEGPYTYLELSKDKRLTPDIYAWKEGMEDWLPISEIEELKTLFKHRKPAQEEDVAEESETPSLGDDELVLDLKGRGPSPFLWLLLLFLLFLLVYALYRFL